MIPTTVVELILDYTTPKDYTQKQKNSLHRILIELWLFVYDRQISNQEFSSLKMFVNIHSEEMKHFQIKLKGKVLPVNKLISILVDLELISRNKKYSAGNFTAGYKIKTDVLSTGKLTEVQLNLDKVFRNIRPKQHWLDLYPQHSHLIEDIYTASIRLDDYLNYLLSNIGMSLHPKTVKRTLPNGREITYTKPQFLTMEKAYQYIHMAMKINIGNIWVAEFTTGRFASSVSNMSFTATKFFQMDKVDLIDIDIKNSQPLLLAKLINCPEYKRDVENGVFYDNMAKEICRLKKKAYKEDIHRDMFKTNSYRYIFFNQGQLGHTGNIGKAMNTLYPGALAQINALKTDGTLAGKLQRLEADIFVNFIGMMNIKKLLRHDQVLIEKDYEKQIKSVLATKYKEMGLKVSFNKNTIIKDSNNQHNL